MAGACPATCFAPPERWSDDELDRIQLVLAEDTTFRALIDAMPELVMIVGPTRQIVMGNRMLAEFAASRGCESFMGMRPGELLSCRHVPAAPGGCGTGEACRTCGAVEAILAGLSGNSSCHECRVLMETGQGGEALDLKVWGSPFHWCGESLVLLVAVDISDDKRRKVLERIFFHDILNSVGAIRGLAQLLVEGALSFEEAGDDLIRTAQSLVSEIRSQHELLAAENNELQVEPVELHSRLFLESLVLAHRDSPLGRGREIVLAPGLCETLFYSDELLLGRVMGNLLKNALEASTEEGAVSLGCSVNGEEISFWCRNRVAIPRETQQQIFNRSFSTKERGRGIGTYSVKLLTERYLNGRVSFTSNEDEGTTFTVTLPIRFPG